MAAKGTTTAASQISVSKVFKLKSGEEVGDPPVDEMISVHVFQTEPAVVNLGFGLTINMGNFESCRLDVGIRVPCYKEQAAEAYTAAKEFVELRVKQEIADIQSSKKKQLF